MRSQAEGDFTVLFAGGVHAENVANMMKDKGYVSVLQEGNLVRVRGSAVMNDWSDSDAPIDNRALETLFSEVIKKVKSAAHKTEL